MLIDASRKWSRLFVESVDLFFDSIENFLFGQPVYAGVGISGSPKFKPYVLNESHKAGGSDKVGEKGDKPDFEDLKKNNPGFQEIFDYAIGKGRGEVERKMSQEKEELKERNKQVLADFRKLETDFRGTDAERKDLRAKIEKLEEQMMSSEEISAKRLKEQREAQERERKAISKERDTFKQNYFDNLIDTAIMGQLTADLDAYNPKQVVSLARENCDVVEVLDESGKPTGKYTVKYTTYDDEAGEDRTYKFAEGFKKWAELEQNDNLFKKRLHGGSDDGKNHRRPGSDTVGEIKTMEDYRKNREKIRDLPASG
jgi:hypothetical protein